MAPDASVTSVGGGVIGAYTAGGMVEQLAGAVDETDGQGKRVAWLFEG